MQRIPPWVALTVAGFCVIWVLFGSRTLAIARAHDFLNLYTGASLALEGRFADLHNPDVQLARERQLVPQLPSLVPFVRPAFYAVVLMPLALLPYNTAFVVWIATQSLLLLACWIWGWWRFGPDALVFAALFLPAPLGIATGQDCVMMLVIFIAAFELSERSRWFASGAVLALMLMKFHLIFLWPVALLLQRRWKMLAGFCSGAIALATICVALGGIGSIRMYAALLQNKSLERLSPSPELMISVQGLTANLGITSTVVTAGLIVTIVAIFAWGTLRSASDRGLTRQMASGPRRQTGNRTDASLWKLFALTATASLWIVPHVYGYDAALLLLPLWLTIYQSTNPAARIAATLLATPIPFGFAMAGRPWAIISSASLLIFFLLLAFTAGERRPLFTSSKTY